MSDFRQPILATWSADVVAQTRRAEEIVAGLPPERLLEPPELGRWSIASCLEHLATTEAAYRPHLDAALARAGSTLPASLGDYRPGRFARWFIRMAGPDGRPMKAPKVFRPPAESPSPRAAELFAESQAALEERLHRADAVDLNRTKLRSPVTPLLRFRIGEALELLVRHNDRHLDQAERVRDALEGRG